MQTGRHGFTDGWRRWSRSLLGRPFGLVAIGGAVLLVVALGVLDLRAFLNFGLFGIRTPKHTPPSLEGVVLSFAWPEMPSSMGVSSTDALAVWSDALIGAEEIPVHVEESLVAKDEAEKEVQWHLRLSWSDGSETRLSVTRDLLLFDAARSVAWVSESLRREVEALVSRLEERTYGELLTWAEVRPHFPVGGEARVRDLETGLSFDVYRHRGDSHADVEPLTVADTETLKRIYGGAWSWKRRSVVVSLGERQVAGSMNGMPHGWGDIFDNEFVGHFCIHFWKSRVHGTWREDPGHQLMVAKSAGRLLETLDEASPEELASWALAAVNHRDVLSLRHMAWPIYPDAEDFYTMFSRIVLPVRHLSHHGTRVVERNETAATVEVNLTSYYHHPDPDLGFSLRFTIQLYRRGSSSPWRVDMSSLLPLLSPAGHVSTVNTNVSLACMD